MAPKSFRVSITVRSRVYHHGSRVVGRKGIYRRPWPWGTLFISIASAAENFRSTCGPKRGAPECSKQRFPEVALHVGQGTDRNISGAMSLIFIDTECNETFRKTVPFCSMPTGHPKLSILPGDCRLATRGNLGEPRENFTAREASSRTFNAKTLFPINH